MARVTSLIILMSGFLLLNYYRRINEKLENIFTARFAQVAKDAKQISLG
jgi:hypothetical protein